MHRRLRHALHVPNFAEPAALVDLAVRAERSGWDGYFVWDHLAALGDAPVADPWAVLAAVAVRTERIVIGTAVTPLARRRPQKVARETVTIDRLSGGRLVLGVGLGNPVDSEYAAFGEPADPRAIAGRLDEALDVVAGLWSAAPYAHEGAHFQVAETAFVPPAAQRPRIPVWAAATVPHRRPLARAARWDGVVLAHLTDAGQILPLTPEQITAARGEIDRHRTTRDRFEVAAIWPGSPSDDERDALAGAGVTWCLVTGWLDDLQRAADAPPM